MRTKRNDVDILLYDAAGRPRISEGLPPGSLALNENTGVLYVRRQDMSLLPISVAGRGAGAAILVASVEAPEAVKELAFPYVCDGTADDVVIQTAIDVLAALGGGLLILSGGVFWIVSDLVERTGVYIEGQGMGVTILRLTAGATADVMTTEDFGSLTGGDTQGGPLQYGIRRLTIDGNKANCPGGGWGLRQFGRAFHHHDFEIVSCNAGGLWSEWGTGDPTLPAITGNGSFSHFNIHDCDGIGVENRGPHDSVWGPGVVYRNKGDAGVNIEGNAGGSQWSDMHLYGQQVFVGTPYELIINSGLQVFRNVVIECALGGGALIKASGGQSDLDVTCYWGGLPGAVRAGVTVGIAGTDPVADCRLKVHHNGTLPNGAIVMANDAGGNIVDLGKRPLINLQGTPVVDDSTITTLDADLMPIGGKILSTGGAVTGIILEQSTIDAADIVLKNNSGNSITFHAVPATSHISGPQLVLAALSSQRLTYSTVMGQWMQA